MDSFLSSIADKAQSAINASPLAGHLPTHLSGRSSSPDHHGQPSANQAAAQGGLRSHALDAFQHQLRTIGQQYSPTSPLQKIITSEKGMAIDFDSVSRDAKAQSKELFTWGQSEAEDLKDVTDRLAYLNFVQGSLAGSLAMKLDTARAPLKALRDAENALTPRRNIRSGIQLQISRLEHDQQPGLEKRIADFKEQLKRAEREDEPAEKQLELLKRKAIRESEQAKWDALLEISEKLVLVSKAAIPIVSALPTLPPTPTQPYTGAQVTAATRASLQRALDNYKTGYINLPTETTPPELHRSDTASFGESHASELSSISSDHTSTEPSIPLTPPPVTSAPLPLHTEPHNVPSPTKPEEPTPSAAGKKATDPIDPLTLNQTPTTIPTAAATASPPAATPADVSVQTGIVPTVAETGVPVSAGAEGPGPASGSLLDLRPGRGGGSSGGESSQPASAPPAAAAVVAAAVTPTHESAEDEKRRLQKERLLSTQSSVTAAAPSHETAEDEKKRLEREERERILRTDEDAARKDDEEDLPPYQPI